MVILGEVERYLRQHDMSWTRFGRLVAKDPRLVADLRNGRRMRATTCARVEAFIAAAAPEARR